MGLSAVFSGQTKKLCGAVDGLGLAYTAHNERDSFYPSVLDANKHKKRFAELSVALIRINRRRT